MSTFNIENLFDLQDNPAKDDEGSTPSPEELEVKLSELALADRVNATAGTSYLAVSFETIDGRGIERGFMWDAARVGLLDAYQLAGPDVEAAFGPASSSSGREPMVGVFEHRGRELTIVNNHFKSKRGDHPLFGVNVPAVLDADPGTAIRASDHDPVKGRFRLR